MKVFARRVAVFLSVLSLLLLACALTAWARGGGGGGGHGGGGGGGHSSGGGGFGGGGFYGGSHYYGGGGYGRSYGPQTPLTPAQAEAQRRQRNRMLAYGAGGFGAAAVGGGALWYGMSGFDLIALGFVLRRKRDYVGAIDRLVEDTNFADADSRDELLRNIGSLFATDDMEEAYAIPIPIKRNSDGAARQGAELDRQHQALADVKLQYQDGGQATAQGDREAATTDDDRCVLSVIVSAQRGLARRFQTCAGSAALEALKLLASSGSPAVDGLWVFYVPALEEPLPADYAKMIFGNLHACDTNFKASDALPVEAPEPEPGEDQRAA